MNSTRKSETEGIILYRNNIFLFYVYKLIFENILMISFFIFLKNKENKKAIPE